MIKQGPCPKCSSSDAFTEYPDGSAWCFSCKHYVPPENSVVNIKKRTERKEKKLLGGSENTTIIIPEDASGFIPKEPLTWLKSYGITDEEIKRNNVVWSPDLKMLIFPSFDQELNVIFWQGRYFPKQTPKIYTEGFSANTIHIIKGPLEAHTDVLVIVEDFVSAMKVARYNDCLCLFGSHISPHLVTGLRHLGYKELVIWLDPDKNKDSLKFKNRYGILFLTRCIFSEKDPKEHSNKEILKYLTG